MSESIVRRPGRWQWLTYLLLAVVMVFFLLPVHLVIVTALKQPAAITLEATWRLPVKWNWTSFAQAWTAFLPKLRNSLLLGVAATLLSSILGTLNGYVLYK